MNEYRRARLSANMLACSYVVKKLLMRIAEVEADTETPLEDKVSQIKKIKDEITKVGTEIDSIKKEITLLNAYNVN
jgi:type I restriction-modification system DNA methylase subunit